MFSFFDFSSSRRVACVLSLAVLLIARCSSPLFGQNLATAASLSGIIVDPQGARVKGATVTLASQERGITRKFTTDSSGTYSFNLLPPTVYSLKVEVAGFEKFVQNKITLEVGQSGSLNITLTVGSVGQVVEVSGETPLLKTDNANISSEIAQEQIAELPLNLRNPVSLVFLDSSVKNIDEGYMGAGLDTADEDISYLSFGGQFFGGTAYVLDGAWDTAIGNNKIAYVSSVDSLQEFKVQTNSFTAQYGLSTGNAINIITKSGTNRFHGDVYEFIRNSALDANYYFNNYNGVPKTALRLNQFGASAGGPVYIPGVYKQTDRTFFFVLYEGFRETTPSSTTLTTPTTAFKAGDESALLGRQIGTDALGRPILSGQIYNPFSTRQIGVDSSGKARYIRDPIPGNNLANMIDPVAKNLLQYFPTPTNTNQFNNFFKASGVPIISNEFIVRVDQNIASSGRLYGRYSRKTESKTTSAPLYGATNPAGPGEVSPDNRYSVALGYSQAITSTLTASVNVGFQRWTPGAIGQGYPFKPSSLGLPGELDSITPIFPSISPSSYAPLGHSFQNQQVNNIGTISTDITKSFGPHTFSFGYMGILQQLDINSTSQSSFSFTQAFTSGPDPNSASLGTGDPFASFLLGTAVSGSTGNSLPQEMSKLTNGLYFQDDWKATTKLTLNLGIRYDIQGAVTEKRNRQAYFDPTAVNPISPLVGGTYPGALVFNTPSNRGNYQTHYDNLAPRLGFAYEGFQKFVVRGGFGIFFPPNFIGMTSNPGYAQSTSLISSLNGGLNPVSTLSNPFSQGILLAPGNAKGGLTDVGQNVPATFVYNRASYYSEQWSFGFQYSPTYRDVAEATYVGNHVVHVPVGSNLNLNQLPPQDLALGSAALTASVPNKFYGQPAVAGSSCGLASPTVPAYQLMLPMPQYCNNVTSEQPPLGFSNYNSLQLRYTHRAKDLLLLANYTWAKWIDNAMPSPPNDSILYPSVTRNNYDLSAEKSVDEKDTPNAAVVSFIYHLPVGRGKRFASNINRPVDALIGGWELSTINTFKQGTPIGPQGNVNPGSLFGGNQHPNVVGDPNKPGTVANNPGCTAPNKLKTVQAWFNPCAFVAAPAGTFGNAPRYMSNLRTPGYAFTDLAIEKWFNLPESIRAQFRAEMFNAFNHPIFGEPFATVGASNMGTLGFADVSRQIQFGLKIYW